MPQFEQLRRTTILMPFIQDRKNSNLIRSLQGINDNQAEGAFLKLMIFFGDTEEH